MITSATPGEGKTSLTLALGLSFAAAGKRVLMIDSDLIGQGLTHRLDRGGSAGLAESLDSKKLVRPELIRKNLSLLPVGQVSDGREHFGFSVEEMHDLMEQAIPAFDIILIDTGPALATLHTPVVAKVVDHVVMTIASGQQQALVERSMKMLQSVGIRVSGFVFNRARQKDYRKWIGGDSYYAASAKAARIRAIAVTNGAPAYGPLAASMTPRVAALANGDQQ
jgi:Mrp family chromosome partitioning ATPase